MSNLFIQLFLAMCLTLCFLEKQKVEEDSANKYLTIQSLVEYYEDEDRRLLLEANELLRLRKEIK